MTEQNELRQSLSADALIKSMFQLNHCWQGWQDWWNLHSAEITIGNRRIEGPLPDPWRSAGPTRYGPMTNHHHLAALNPQPLPPMPVDIALGLEIADRLIGVASAANTLGRWLGRSDHNDGTAIASRLADDVPDLCPPYPSFKVKVPKIHWPVPQPDPGPDPDPIIIKLSPLAQLAMGARFSAAGNAALPGPVGSALKAAGEKIARSGFANLSAPNAG